MKQVTKTCKSSVLLWMSVFGWVGGASVPTYPITQMYDLGGQVYSKTSADSNTFGDGGGISNGTLNITFTSNAYWTIENKTLTVGPGGTLDVQKIADGNGSGLMIVKGGGKLILDGGAMVNRNNRNATSANIIGSGSGTAEVRIVKNGTFTSESLPVRVGDGASTTGILSIDRGTLTVPTNRFVAVGCNLNATGILAVTNGTINGGNLTLAEFNSVVAKLTFTDSTLNVSSISNNSGLSIGSSCIFDGCTFNCNSAKPLSTINNMPYQLRGRGLTLNPARSGEIWGHFASLGNAPLVKTGTNTLTLVGNFTGQKAVGGETGVSDFEVRGGVLSFAGGTYLPATNLNLTVRTGGILSGVYGDLTADYNSLTVDGTVTIPIVFGETGCTEIKAKTLTLDTTVASPVLLACSGAMTDGITYLIREGIAEAEAAKFAVSSASSLAVNLICSNGNLYAESNVRDNGSLVWQGATGDGWWGGNRWLADGNATTFLDGDAAIFNSDGAEVVVNQDAAVSALFASNNVSIAGMKTLSAPVIEVTDGKMATVSAPTAGILTKTGTGLLTLTTSRTEPTTVTEGKLVMAGEASLDPALLTLGNDSEKSVTFANGGKAINFSATPVSGAGEVTLEDGTYAFGDRFTFVDTNMPFVLNVGEGATVASGRRFGIMPAGERTINVKGGSFVSGESGSDPAWIMQDSINGKLCINVTDGGLFRVGSSGSLYALTCRDGKAYQAPELHFMFKDSLFRLNGGDLNMGYDFLNDNAVAPVLTLAMTNSVLDVGNRVVTLGHNVLTNVNKGGSYVGDFENTIITAKQFRVYADRPLNAARFNNTRIVYTSSTAWSLESQSDFETMGAGGTAIKSIYVGAGGLILDSNGYGITLKADLQGPGAVTKVGNGTLTVDFVQSGNSPFIVEKGTLAFGSAAKFTTPKTVFAVDGTTLALNLTADGSCTSNLVLALDSETSGQVTLNLGGMMTIGTSCTLFASGITPETLPRLKTFPESSVLSLDGGQLKVAIVPQTMSWTGAGEDNLWSNFGNWSGGTHSPDAFDSVVFNGDGGLTKANEKNGMELAKITVSSGAWTADVGTASFAATPLMIASGATFALTNAAARTNPFSTALNTNRIEGVLDLGGARQTFTTATGTGLFYAGGEFRNGTFNVLFGGGQYWQLANTTFTVGPGGVLDVNKYANGDSSGLMTIKGGGKLVIEGGAIVNRNNRTSGNPANIIGFGSGPGTAEVRIAKNGSFTSESLPVRVGDGASMTGVLSIDHGTLTVPTNRFLSVGCNANSIGILAVTNGTINGGNLTLGEFASCVARITFKDSTINLNSISNYANLASGSFCIFDGATLVDKGADDNTLLRDIGFPYTIAEGGLTIRIADRTAANAKMTLAGTYDGTGSVMLAAAGSAPKTADVSAVTFPGDVTIEDGISLAFTPVDLPDSVNVLTANGSIAIPDSYREKDAQGRRFFVVQSGGRSVLRYGRNPGFVILVR